MRLVTNPYSFSFDAIDPKKLEPDQHGQVRIKAKIMTIGKLRYVTDDGKEYFGNITLDNLKKAQKTAALKPITIRHPPKMLNASDVKLYQEGFSADAAKIEEIDGKPWLVNDIILQTEAAINTAKEGRLGVSAGYFRIPIPKKGNILDFQNPDINHIAIGCLSPRAEGAELYSLDEAEGESGRIFPANLKKEVQMTEKLKERTLKGLKIGDFSLDEAPIEYTDASKNIVDVYDTREKKMIKEIKILNQRLVDQKTSMDDAIIEVKKELDTVVGQKEALEKTGGELKEKMESLVSMDEAIEQINRIAEVKEFANSIGVKDEFKTEIQGVKLCCHKLGGISSMDEDVSDEKLMGMYSVYKSDRKDSAELAKSRDALMKAGSSMDDGKTVSFADMDVDSIVKFVKRKKGA